MTTKGSQAAGILHFLRRYGAKPALAVILLSSAGAAPSWAAATPRKPKVRAITAFIRIDRNHYAGQIEQALAMLRQAKAGFEKSGYEVETIRITTQPFPQYIQGLPKQKALEFFQALNHISRKESFIPNIGPAMLSDEDDPAQVELLSEILATTGVFASVVVAGEDGLHWKSIRAAGKLIKYVEDHSPQGLNNFDFAATAMLPPHAPFYPGAYHNGPGHQFSVGLEGGNFVADILAEAHGDNRQAAGHLTRELSEHARLLEAVAVQVEKDSGWAYMGLDATPAPSFDSSIGAAMEKLTGAKFGSSGTLTAAALITQALRSLAVKRAGYSGLMLPVLEDPVLAQRWSEGTFNIDSLLAYSAVCGTGLDTVVLPGEVSQLQLEKIMGDVASLAFQWHKPLTARLIPVPGKKAGEHTDYQGPHLVNTTLQPLP